MSELSKARLVELAAEKLAAAEALAARYFWTDAYYLAGYAVELLLKARIAGRFKADTIPDPKTVKGIYIHDLTALVTQAGLDNELRARKADRPAFAENWAITARWTEQARYGMIEARQAQALLKALRDPDDGAVTWLLSSI